MILQYSVSLRNTQLDQIEAVLGLSAVLKIWPGTLPATVATADSGSPLATLSLPSNYMDDAGSGVKSKSAGAWTGTASANGTAGYWRLYMSNGTTCHLQGDISVTAGGGSMTVDNVVFATGQTFTVNTFSITAGNGP